MRVAWDCSRQGHGPKRFIVKYTQVCVATHRRALDMLKGGPSDMAVGTKETELWILLGCIRKASCKKWHLPGSWRLKRHLLSKGKGNSRLREGMCGESGVALRGWTTEDEREVMPGKARLRGA